MNTKNPGKAYAFPGRNLLVSRGTTRIEKWCRSHHLSALCA